MQTIVTNRKNQIILQSIKDNFALALSSFPFGIVMGATAYKFTLNTQEFLYMNLSLNAGASQLAFVDQYKNNINYLVILASCTLINCRMFLYSLSLHSDFKELGTFKKMLLSFFVIDQTYATFETNKDTLITEEEKFWYFLSSGILLLSFWQLGSIMGFFAGDNLPYGEHLDFLVPLAFIGIFGPKLKDRINISVFLVAVSLSVILYKVPFNLGLLLSTIGAMATGVFLEKRKGSK